MLIHRSLAGLSLLISCVMGVVACSGSKFSSGNTSDDGGAEQPDPTDAAIADAGVGDASSDPMPLEASVIGGVSVNPPSGLTTTEGGGQASFEIVLVTEPTSEVRIPLSTSDEGEGTLSVAEVVFTTENWNDPQTIVVTGQDDEEFDGDQTYEIETGEIQSDDVLFSGVDPANIQVTNEDNDRVAVRFEPTMGLVTTEAGGQAQFTVRLLSRPTADVAVFLASSDTTEGTVTPEVLLFNSEDWAAPKLVTVRGQDDDEADGPQDYVISVQRIVGSDPNYADLEGDIAEVRVRNTDDDSAGFTLTGENLVTSEQGGEATFTVVLNREPSDDVLIQVRTSDETEGTATPGVLTFTGDNWNAPQTVTVHGADDSEPDGDQAYEIQLGQALSLDAAYSGLEVGSVAVTNIDDESAGVTVTPLALEVSENRSTAVFELGLNSEPSAPVTIGLSVSDPSEGTVSPTEVVFNPEEWLTRKIVTVQGEDDNEPDGDREFLVLTAPAQSDDDAYRGINPMDVSVKNVDNDTVGVRVEPTTGLMTSENGETATFTIVLQTQPTSEVRLSLESSDESEGSVQPSEILFDAENWDVPVPITVRGQDDPITDGSQTFTIIISDLDSDDENYDEIAVPDVMVTNRDNECPDPAIIDDWEDQNLNICPNQGRSGSWLIENTMTADLVQLRVTEAEREGSDWALSMLVANDIIIGLPSGSEDDKFDVAPTLSTALALDANEEDGSNQSGFNADQYEGVRLLLRADVDMEVRVSFVTPQTAGSIGGTGGCRNGCSGHFSSVVQVDPNWEVTEIRFDQLRPPPDWAGDDFSRNRLLGMKFAVSAESGYELWLDDLTFY